MKEKIAEEVYLTETTNKKVAFLKAAKATSLISEKTVYIGRLMNVFENGLVIDSDGNPLFQVTSMQVQRENNRTVIQTKNNSYVFEK